MKQLAFLVEENVLFVNLVIKIEQALHMELTCKDDKGRYIARGNVKGLSIEVVDQIDRVSGILCDENCVIYIRIFSDDYFCNKFKCLLKNKLRSYGVGWVEAILSPYPPSK